MGKLDAYVCRCEKVTLRDVERAIAEGFTDLESLKRRLRVGMGPCQGRYCIPLLVSILARKLGKSPKEVAQPRVRAPLVPLPARDLMGGESEG